MIINGLIHISKFASYYKLSLVILSTNIFSSFQPTYHDIKVDILWLCNVLSLVGASGKTLRWLKMFLQPENYNIFALKLVNRQKILQVLDKKQVEKYVPLVMFIFQWLCYHNVFDRKIDS